MKALTEKRKEGIVERLRQYVETIGGQNKAANSLKGVSSAIVSQMMNGNWEKISDEMWRNVGSQIGYSESEWQIVETRDFKLMRALLDSARVNSQVIAVTAPAGSGKSLTSR